MDRAYNCTSDPYYPYPYPYYPYPQTRDRQLMTVLLNASKRATVAARKKGAG